MDPANGKAGEKGRIPILGRWNNHSLMMEPFQKVWLCHSMWLFHLHSAVKIQPFSLVFPLAGSTAKAFYRLILWSFKEKASTIFHNTAFFFGLSWDMLFYLHSMVKMQTFLIFR